MTLRRKLTIVAGLYFVEGFPMGMYRDVWPVYFRTQGLSLAEIGFLSALFAAWSAKFLWSPLVDRFGERRRWIVAALATMALALLGLSGLGASRATPLLWAVLGAYCLASATQDIAIDAYTIGLLDRDEEGPANGVRITAYRAALLAAGGGLVAAAEWLGWHTTLLMSVALTVGMAAGVGLAPRVAVPAAARREFAAPLRRWLAQPGAAGVFLFVLLYRVGDLAMGPMVRPFWVDRAGSLGPVWRLNIVGVVATVIGALAGGVWVARHGIFRSLLVLGVLALASNLGYAVVAAWPASGIPGLYAASVLESLCAGLASAAFLSFLMRICEKEHAAVQYALLTAVYALPGSGLAAVSGVAAERLGYAAYFAWTAVLALPAFAFLPGVRPWLAERGDASA